MSEWERALQANRQGVLRRAMTDLERLAEALTDYENAVHKSEVVWDQKAIIAAARAYRDLLANGVCEEWFCNSVLAPRCTEASRDKVREMFGGHDSCQKLAFLLPNAFLVDPTTEEER